MVHISDVGHIEACSRRIARPSPQRSAAQGGIRLLRGRGGDQDDDAGRLTGLRRGAGAVELLHASVAMTRTNAAGPDAAGVQFNGRPPLGVAQVYHTVTL